MWKYCCLRTALTLNPGWGSWRGGGREGRYDPLDFITFLWEKSSNDNAVKLTFLMHVCTRRLCQFGIFYKVQCENSIFLHGDIFWVNMTNLFKKYFSTRENHAAKNKVSQALSYMICISKYEFTLYFKIETELLI